MVFLPLSDIIILVFLSRNFLGLLTGLLRLKKLHENELADLKGNFFHIIKTYLATCSYG